MSKKEKKQVKTTESPLRPRRIKIKVIGIGGGGASIVSEIARHLKGVSFLVADTDTKVFKKVKRGIKVFQFGQNLAGGMGTGMDPELAQKAAEAEKEKIAKIFSGQDLVIFIGCLGGGVASGAGPVFAEVARTTTTSHKGQPPITLGIFTLPFSFEGEKKMKIAKRALEKLRENLSGTVFVSNEKIFQIIDKKTPLKKALSSLNQIFIEWLKDLIEVISKPNLINIDFADLRTILKERGKLLFFSQAVAQGANRQEELFQNPLFENTPKNVRRILFNISGGKDLGLKELERVSKEISELNPRAKIIFGVSENPKYKGKIKITLIAVSESEQKQKWLGEKKPKKSQGKKKEKLEVKIKQKKQAEPKRVVKKKKIRRTALEIKKAEKEAQEREWVQEPEWEIPAFLRRKIK
jgi:cell division protein FtsZ